MRNDGPCSVTGCGRLAKCKGLCHNHYIQARYHAKRAQIRTRLAPRGLPPLPKVTLADTDPQSEHFDPREGLPVKTIDRRKLPRSKILSNVEP